MHHDIIAPIMASRQIPHKIEALLLIAIVLVAIIFRFAAFNQVPPGLHYDEAIDAKLAQEIRSGAWPIYFEEGWGREPLYHYLVALTLNVIPDPASALRLVSGILGMVQLLAAYFLFRKLFGVPTALIGSAWLAVLFWTVSTSRAGLRNITLTTLATLTALTFWSVWSKVQSAKANGFSLHTKRSAFILPGVLLGLTIYTYQPGRVVPLIYLLFVGYLFWRERALLKANWKGLALFFGVAALVAAPLFIYLATHPGAETERAFQTEPIRALATGNFAPVMETAIATLKMFTFDGGGDPQILYNLTGRPIFIGLGSLLFVIGLLVSVIRFKRPAHAFMLIWLAVTLLPNMLTAPAPFFYRAIATQTPVVVMPAIATVVLGEWAQRVGGSKRSWLAPAVIALVAVLSLGQTAITTWQDYFNVWGNNKDVRFQYSAAYAEIAAALKAANDVTPVAVSGYFIEDADPIIFDQALNQPDRPVRWFDAREALAVAAYADIQHLALPAYTPLADELESRFLNDVEPIAQSKDFKIYPFDAARFRAQIEAWTPCADCPARFNGDIELLGLDRSVTISRASGVLPILSAWRIVREGQPGSTAIFMHVLDSDGQVATRADRPAQDDRLGVPRHSWQPGDEFVQVHRIPIDQLLPGKYTLEVGLYNRGDNVRWAARDRSGNALGDHVILGEIEVVP
jgi:4-amino-4-deoxy-L-arabinose transferase-like glycosyltransferase